MRYKLAELSEKTKPNLCCLNEIHFSFKDTQRLKVKSCIKVFHANGNQKRARIARLISDKINFI